MDLVMKDGDTSSSFRKLLVMVGVGRGCTSSLSEFRMVL